MHYRTYSRTEPLESIQEELAWIEARLAGDPHTADLAIASINWELIEEFGGTLHLGIETLVGDVNSARVGIAAPVAEDVHHLQALAEGSRQCEHFIERLCGVVGDVSEAKASPEFPHAAGDELSVFFEFFRSEGLGWFPFGGRLEALQIENLPAQNDAPGVLDFGGIRHGFEGFEEIGQPSH